MSDKNTLTTAREESKQQMQARMDFQFQHEKHRIKLETLREYIVKNGSSASGLAAAEINKAFDAITL